jgi:RecA/RadA recombinase
MITQLTDKQIITELLQWYSIDNLASQSGISDKIINRFIKDDLDCFESTPIKNELRSFFTDHIKTNSAKVTIEQLKNSIENKKNIAINTPDNFQNIKTFFNKKERQLFLIETENNYSIKCSEDHLIETESGWVLTKDLNLDTKVLTQSGLDKIATITKLDIEKVYDFEVDHPNHRYWGGKGISSHNSGKSYLSSNGLKQAQLEGAHLVILDSENALDTNFLKKIGVNTSEEHLTYIQVGTFENVNSVCSEFFTNYEKDFGKDNYDAPRFFFLLDSIAMLGTATEFDNYEKKGEVKGDQGQRAKRSKAMLRMILSRISRLPITFVVTDHVYPQDPLLGDGAWAVTNSTKFFPSIIGMVSKLKLKEDSEVIGVRMRVETYKSRFAKLGSKVELEVPYTSGMSPFSGLLDMLESDGVVTKAGAWYSCSLPDGDIKFQKKQLDQELATKLLSHPKIVELEKEIDMIIEESGLEEQVFIKELTEEDLQDDDE